MSAEFKWPPSYELEWRVGDTAQALGYIEEQLAKREARTKQLLQRREDALNILERLKMENEKVDMTEWIAFNVRNHDNIHNALKERFPDYAERVERGGSLAERFPEMFPETEGE